jgi:hypothetical protein
VLVPEPVQPQLELLGRCEAQLGEPIELGATRWGRRRLIAIAGGRFEGPRLTGELLPGGADWQVVHDGGWATIGARYPLRTDDGALVVIESAGVRSGAPEVLDRLGRGELVDPSEYYFRTALAFDTAEEPYGWLNRVVALASAVRTADAVRYDAYVVT